MEAKERTNGCSSHEAKESLSIYRPLASSIHRTRLITKPYGFFGMQPTRITKPNRHVFGPGNRTRRGGLAHRRYESSRGALSSGTRMMRYYREFKIVNRGCLQPEKAEDELKDKLDGGRWSTTSSGYVHLDRRRLDGFDLKDERCCGYVHLDRRRLDGFDLKDERCWSVLSSAESGQVLDKMVLRLYPFGTFLRYLLPACLRYIPSRKGLQLSWTDGGTSWAKTIITRLLKGAMVSWEFVMVARVAKCSHYTA
nr:hypothetical protein [Tanacetum cinerariifolium]